MKKRYIAVAAVAALVAGSYAWLRDEAPSAEVQSWMQQLEARPDRSAAYLFLNGLDAPLGQDPAELGAKRLEAYQRWVAEHGDGEHFAPSPQEVLALPQGPIFCAKEQQGCLPGLIASGPEPLTAEQQGLLERYQDYLQLDDYATLTEPSYYEPLPPFSHLLRGNRLQALEALRLAKAGDGQAALALLEADVAALRRQLAAADHLIIKIVMISMLDQDLDWMAQLYRHGLIPSPQPTLALSQSERSMQVAFVREFGGGAALFAGLRASEAGSALGRERLGYAALRLVYKPQMSINRLLPPFQKLVERSLLSPAAFREELLSDTSDREPDMQWRNYVGSVLLNISGPDFNGYIGRLHDLDAKLKLLNLLPQLPVDSAPSKAQLAALTGADNPYQPGVPPFWNATTGQLCYTGPLPEHKGSRCL